jgi:drug/metabolite transporter (DMT)-like permease
MGIAALAAQHLLPGGLTTWQAMFLVGSTPAFLCVFILAKLKEPQKWVDAKAAGKISGIKFGSYGALLSHPRWRKHAWAGLALCSAGIIGLWGIGNFHPTIVSSVVVEHLKNSGISAEKLASEKAFWTSVALLLQNVGAFFGMTAMAKLAQVKGRKFAFALALFYILGEHQRRGDNARDALSLTMWGMGGAALFWVLVPPWSLSAWGAYAGMSEPLAGRGPQVPLWALTLWMVVMGTVVPFVLAMKSLAYVTAAQASTIGMTEPLIASIIAWIVLAEVLTPVQIAGGVIVLVGVYLAERSR